MNVIYKNLNAFKNITFIMEISYGLYKLNNFKNLI